ncbi:MAG TPA: hypothetical protein DIU15_01285 [Deltaproteobacteria bacterium]|nr:hypothetical protein [Deltaproteobacteria bacterium]
MPPEPTRRSTEYSPMRSTGASSTRRVGSPAARADIDELYQSTPDLPEKKYPAAKNLTWSRRQGIPQTPGARRITTVNAPRHVVIIGAGITGAFAAHHLLKAGVRVTVLEAREKGAGSSSRSAACLRQQFSTPATVQAMVYSVAAYRRFAEEFRCSDGQGDVLVQNGYLFLYDRPDASDSPEHHSQRWKQAQSTVAMQQAHGLRDVELLSPEAIEDRFPHIRSDDLVGATFCPSDGFLRADMVYQEGFRRVVEMGGVLRQNEAVTGGVFDSNGRLQAVETSAGDRIEADIFINATNAWAPRVSESLGGSTLPISPIKRYLYFIERGPSITGDQLLSWPMTITSSRAYCRPENAEQLLAGWAHAAEAEPGFDWDDQDHIEPGFFHRSGLDNYGYQLWLQLAEALSIVGEFAGLAATTSGFYAVTPDHNPLIGFDPLQPTLLQVAGFSGHGAMMGPFSGAAAAAMALAGETLDQLDIEGTSIDLRHLVVGRQFNAGEGLVI